MKIFIAGVALEAIGGLVCMAAVDDGRRELALIAFGIAGLGCAMACRVIMRELKP